MAKKSNRLARRIYYRGAGKGRVIVIVVQRGHKGDANYYYKEPRYDVGTPLKALVAERDRLYESLKIDGPPVEDVIVPGDNLAGDVPRFLRLVSPDPTNRKRKTHERRFRLHILPVVRVDPVTGDPAGTFGDAQRNTITAADVRHLRGAWVAAGIPTASINKYLTSLHMLYLALNGDEPGAYDPVMRIARDKAPERAPRDIDFDLIDLILSNVSDRGWAPRGQPQPTFSAGKIRLRLMAYTGMPQAQVMRTEPRLCDFVGRRIFLVPRRKGKGSHGQWVRLVPQAFDALRDYSDRGLIGSTFQPRGLCLQWRRAVKKTKAIAAKALADTGTPEARLLVDRLAAIPDNSRPYDLRHSFITAIVRVGGVVAAQEMAQHATIAQTMHYGKGAVSEIASRAVDAFGAAHPGGTPAPVPSLRIVAIGERRSA